MSTQRNKEELIISLLQELNKSLAKIIRLQELIAGELVKLYKIKIDH